MNLLTDLAGLGPAVSQRLRSLEARLKRTTARERLLLGGLLAAALIYAPIVVFDWRENTRNQYNDAVAERSTARLARVAALRSNDAASDRAAIEDMNTWGFKAGNIAIAQVQLEQRLVDATADAALANVKITTDAKEEAIGPTTWLGAEIQADLHWSATFAFLDGLARWPEGLRVTRFKYDLAAISPLAQFNPRTVLPAGRVVIGIAVPVSVPEASTEPTTRVAP